MAYGFEVYNSSGELLIDDDFPTMYLHQAGNFSGSPISSATAPDSVLLVQLPVGGYAGLDLNGNLYTNVASLNYRRGKLTSALSPSSTGYGVEIYNSSGQVTWSANQTTLAFGDRFTFTFTAAQFTTAEVTCLEEWFVIPGSLYVAKPNTTLYLRGVWAVERTASNRIRGRNIQTFSASGVPGIYFVQTGPLEVLSSK